MSYYYGCNDILAIGVPGGMEWVIVLVVALLIFGKRLPEVARNMGKGIVEFKKGVKGIEEDVEDASSEPIGHGQGHGQGSGESSPQMYDDHATNRDNAENHPPKV